MVDTRGRSLAVTVTSVDPYDSGAVAARPATYGRRRPWPVGACICIDLARSPYLRRKEEVGMGAPLHETLTLGRKARSRITARRHRIRDLAQMLTREDADARSNASRQARSYGPRAPAA
ncbi:hypothetical protein ACIRIU_19120 [Streptomyces sp. NPDC102351]|uniref:hypothetical protein n=1 Tax=Streptomyces sp. NPDC102351 TaxID=3366158 RepID=UPI0037FC6A07